MEYKYLCKEGNNGYKVFVSTYFLHIPLYQHVCVYRTLSIYYIYFDIVVHVHVCEDDTGGGVDGVEGAKVLSLRLQRERWQGWE